MDPYDSESINYVPLYSILTELDNWSLPSWASAALEHRKHLITPNSFPRYTSASVESKLKPATTQASFNLPSASASSSSSSSSPPKSTHKVSSDEHKLALEATSKFDLDALEALVLVRSYKVWLKGPKAWDSPEAELDVDDLDSLQIFYFDERLAVVHLLRALSNAVDDSEAPEELKEFATEYCKELFQPATSFSQNILSAFQDLTVRPLPDTTSALKAAEFGKQCLREQREWLDLLFIWWYRHPATGPECVKFLTAVQQTEWAVKQSHSGFWDAEAAHQAKAVRHALVLLSLIVLNLESYATTDDAASSSVSLAYEGQPMPESTDLLHPDNLKPAHAHVVALAQAFPDYAAPLALGWSHILCCLTEGLEENSVSQKNVAQPYASFVQDITAGDQPLWQRLLSHVLPRLFPCLSGTLSTLASTASDALGVLLVLRVPLALLLTMVEPAFLPDAHLQTLNDFAVRLYGHEEAQVLRQQFWGNKFSADESMAVPDLLTVGQSRLFDFQARRFPLHPSPFLRLLRALSGAAQSPEAEWAVLSLRQLPCITCLVSTSPLLRVYDIDPANPQHITIAHPAGLQVSPSVTVPVATDGWLLSDISGPQAVARFELAEAGWDAWAWIDDLLDGYVNFSPHIGAATNAHNRRSDRKQQNKLITQDPFAADPSGSAPAVVLEASPETDQAAADALDLLAKDMLRDESDPFQKSSSAQRCANMLFGVLEKSLFTKAQAVSAAALQALKALLPLYPGMVWSLIRAGKGDLFTVGLGARSSRGGTALLAADRNAGTYGPLLALLDLVYALVDETKSTIVNVEYLQVKAEVLSSAFTWLLEEVFTAGFGSWRFQDSKDRWKVAAKLLDIFGLVAADSQLGQSAGHLGGAAETLLIPMLVECTANTGEVIMPLIGILSAAYDGIVTGIKAAVDAEACRQALRSSLNLILQLLFLRPSLSQTPSLLERALITAPIHSARSGKSASRAPISTLFACCLNATALQVSISEKAAQALAAIALLSPDFKSTPLGPQSLAPIFSRPEEHSDMLLEIANSEHLPVSFRVTIWQLMTALLSTQPAVTMLFALGRLGPPKQLSEKAEASQVEKKKQQHTVNKSVDVVKQAHQLPAEVLHAVLSFLETTWTHVQDFPSVIEPIREDAELWKIIVELATSSIPPAIAPNEEPDAAWVEEAATGQCHRTMARAIATRIVTADLTARQETIKKSEKAPSFSALLDVLNDHQKMDGCLSSALANDADIPLHAELLVLFKTQFPSFQLASVHRHTSFPYTSVSLQRPLGNNYLYDAGLGARRVRSAAAVNYDQEELLGQLLQVNLNWSFIDTQLTVTKAWTALLSVAYPFARSQSQSSAVSDAAMKCSISIVGKVAEETQRGDIIAAIHAARLSCLASLLEGALCTGKFSGDQITGLVNAATSLLNSNNLNPFDAIRTAPLEGFHRPLVSFLYLTVTAMSQPSFSQSARSLPSASAMNRLLETVVRLIIANLRMLLFIPSASDDAASTVVSDIAMVSTLFQAIVRLPHAPPPSIWLSYCLEADLFRVSFTTLSSMSMSFTTDSSKVAAALESLLSMLLAMAAFGPAAERIATEGFLMSLTTSTIASVVEQHGVIKPFKAERPGERNPLHHIWCLSTAVVARLAMVLDKSPSFTSELSGFVQLFLEQLKAPLRWSTSSPLSLALVEEMEPTVGIVAFLGQTAPGSDAFLSLSEEMWTFTNTLVYSIQHPNTVLSVIEPLSSDERKWLDCALSEQADSDTVGFSSRPSTGALIQVFLGLLGVLLKACCLSVDAFDVLKHDEGAWPFEKAVVYPTAKVNLNEPATIGTFIDLITWCIDLLRHHPTASVPDPSQGANPTPLLPLYGESQTKDLSKDALETSVLLATSQMALVYSRAAAHSRNKDMVRMRRDIASELAPDLLSLVNKAHSLEQSDLKRSQSGSSAKPSLIQALQRFISLRFVSM